MKKLLILVCLVYLLSIGVEVKAKTLQCSDFGKVVAIDSWSCDPYSLYFDINNDDEKDLMIDPVVNLIDPVSGKTIEKASFMFNLEGQIICGWSVNKVYIPVGKGLSHNPVDIYYLEWRNLGLPDEFYYEADLVLSLEVN